MKSVRILGGLSAAVLLSASIAIADQPGQGKCCPTHGRAAACRVELTESQKARMKPIHEKYREEFRKARAEKLSPEAKQTRLRQLRAKKHAECCTVLTPEQRAKQENLRKMWERKDSKERGARGETRGRTMMECWHEQYKG